ncbi:hypothetical protein [Pseudonocardia sp.]|uniref:hypothetical protein n=1 Tax=Pseudonocardia sp. TaxID=60912 RepID=UPI0031FBC718
MTAAADVQATGRAWARSLLLVLPMLAAIFLMHGLQCGGDDHGAEHTLMALGAPHAGGMVHAAGHAGAFELAGTVHAAAGATLAVDRGATEPTVRDVRRSVPPPVPAAGVCLMLLTAGGVLVLVALRMLRGSAPDDDPGGPSGAGPLVPIARPPSLAQLCVLRI